MSENAVPYFKNEHGTNIYGSNKAGASSWYHFDEAVADMVRPAQSDRQDSVIKNGINIVKMAIIGFISSLVAFFIVYHILDWHVLGWLVLIGLLFGLPGYAIYQANQDKLANKSIDQENSTLKSQARARFDRITSNARHGIMDPSVPPSIARLANSAMVESRTGKLLDKLGHNYEVAHDVTVVDNAGTPISNINHLVSTANGLVLVESVASIESITTNDKYSYDMDVIEAIESRVESLNTPVRAAVIIIEEGQVSSVVDGTQVNGIARIQIRHTLFGDIYIVEKRLVAELFDKISDGGLSLESLPHVNKRIENNARVQF